MSIFEYDEELHRRTLLEEGIEIGERRGIEQGRQQGIRDTIGILREINLPKEEIMEKIMKKYEITYEQAKEYWRESQK